MTSHNNTALVRRVQRRLATRSLRMFYIIPPSVKSTWCDGPWQRSPWVHEPDVILWTERVTRFPCVIARNPEYGSLCGYVGVPPGHLMHGVEYDSGVIPMVLSAMKGEEPCFELTPHEGVNHSKPLDWIGRLDTRIAQHWYFGFDCAHGMDYSPAAEMRLRIIKKHLSAKHPKEFAAVTALTDALRAQMLNAAGPEEASVIARCFRKHYRSIDYVIGECLRLAAQLSTTSLTT